MKSMANDGERRKRPRGGTAVAMFGEEEVRGIDGFKTSGDDDLHVEVKCGCSSREYGDTLGRLRVFLNGDLQITCNCVSFCQRDNLTASEFEKHAGRESSRKWQSSIWVKIGGKKVPLYKTPLLKYYVQARKSASGSLRTESKQVYHHNALKDINFQCTDKPQHKVNTKENVAASGMVNAPEIEQPPVTDSEETLPLQTPFPILDVLKMPFCHLKVQEEKVPQEMESSEKEVVQEMERSEEKRKRGQPREEVRKRKRIKTAHEELEQSQQNESANLRVNSKQNVPASCVVDPPEIEQNPPEIEQNPPITDSVETRPLNHLQNPPFRILDVLKMPFCLRKVKEEVVPEEIESSEEEPGQEFDQSEESEYLQDSNNNEGKEAQKEVPDVQEVPKKVWSDAAKSAQQNNTGSEYRSALGSKFRSRVSLYTVKKVMNSLTPDQRNAVRKLKLGGLLNLQTTIIRKDFAKFIAEAFDPFEKTLTAHGKTLTLDVDEVGKLLGVRCKGQVLEVTESNREVQEMVIALGLKEHKNTSIGDFMVYFSDIKERDAGEEFQRRITLLLLGLFCMPCSQPGIRSTLVPLVMNLDKLRKVNWARMIYDYFCNSLKRVKRGQQYSVSGCILVPMLFYMERFIPEGADTPPGSDDLLVPHRLRFWCNKHIKERWEYVKRTGINTVQVRLIENNLTAPDKNCQKRFHEAANSKQKTNCKVEETSETEEESDVDFSSSGTGEDSEDSLTSDTEDDSESEYEE